jgi:hypothetical protein
VSSPSTVGASSPEPAVVEAIVDILSALEYGKKKEETELLDTAFGKFGIERRATKVEVAPVIARKPGFEPFFLAVVDEVKPFAQMLSEVYVFLGRRATVGRRASTFHVTTAGAEAVFDFSLAAFPKQLLPLLMNGQVEQARMALMLPEATTRREHPLVKRWEALSGKWDYDFYDHRDPYTRFFRLASYASLMRRRRMSAADWSRIETVVEPVMDRLAALLDAFVAAGVNMGLPTGMRLLSGDLELQLHAAHAYAVQAPTPDQLATPALPFYRERSFGDLFGDLSKAWAVAVHLWRTPERVRSDENLTHELGPDSDPARYPDALISAADAFTSRLDEVAPIVDRQTQQLTVERFIEFTELPFWKHRWFLYELWTLVRVLDAGARAGTITLEGLTQPRPGVHEWVLPGGMASAPVARITNGTRSVSVWTQLKSQHPETRAGLEPDLRIRRDRKPEADLFLIENKDRLTITTGTLAEIVRRYVTGTKVQGAWFVNYETFPSGAADLESGHPGRGVRVVSKFRPDNVPEDFEPSLLTALGSELQPSPVLDPYVAVILEWTAPPDDLDVHAWVERGGVHTHVSYRARGSLSGRPYAALDVDERKGGAERLVVATRDLERLTIAVHRYSSNGSVKSARATIRVEALDAQQRTRQVIDTRTVSDDSAADWWHVLEMDAAGESRWHDTLRVMPPLPIG